MASNTISILENEEKVTNAGMLSQEQLIGHKDRSQIVDADAAMTSPHAT